MWRETYTKNMICKGLNFEILALYPKLIFLYIDLVQNSAN